MSRKPRDCWKECSEHMRIARSVSRLEGENLIIIGLLAVVAARVFIG